MKKDPKHLPNGYADEWRSMNTTKLNEEIAAA